MYTDNYGQIIYTENDLCEIILKDVTRQLRDVLVDKHIEFDNFLDLDNTPKLTPYIKQDISVEQFDHIKQTNWYMPDKYKSLDIAQHVLDLCSNDNELQRVGEELIMFQERNMFDLLRYLKYLVDTMRENNIVWGVGRGSSVSSFVLFLLGVHRINSLYYNLSIDEFLK